MLLVILVLLIGILVALVIQRVWVRLGLSYVLLGLERDALTLDVRLGAFRVVRARTSILEMVSRGRVPILACYPAGPGSSRWKEALVVDEPARFIAVKLREYRKLIELTMKVARLDDLVLRAYVGTGDAAGTALVTGYMWAALSAGLSVARRVIHVQDPHPDLQIHPCFDRERFELDGSFTVRFRLLEFLIIGYHYLRIAGKLRRS